ncbi:MAG TPA: thiosulfate oxidation carrier protein SoxY [Rhodocyclaceae bacterium]|jgi:sulfur-oxidizing protein SoxY|nr:thiosulfate oxidation carrier protein SoxY [Rhodocyclaceae bacterium]
MNKQRREVLKAGSNLGLLALLVGIGLLRPDEARAEWNKAAFEAKSFEDTLKALGVLVKPIENGNIRLVVPEVAENGALVPVAVVSSLTATQSIAILVEKNPNALTANFIIPDGTVADVSVRVKMDQTSNVYALVKSNDKFFLVGKEVKVTVGGCGG